MKQEKLEKEIEKTLQESKIVLPKGPHRNNIQNWWFDEQEILQANRWERLLTLDLDVGKYCDLDCSFCFATTQNSNSDNYKVAETERVKSILREGKKLGLQTIKIVGAGEPFLFPNLLQVVKYARELDIRSVIFTTGHIIGDDDYARKMFKREGVYSGRNLAKRLKDLDASVIVKYLTFDDNLHTRLVRPKKKEYNYTAMRDQGLLNLIAAGLNTSDETQLGVDCLLLQENYKEALDLFSFFNKYNIHVFMNTTVDCGNTRQAIGNQSVLTKDQAQQTAEKIYQYCKDINIPIDAVSPYFAAPPCAQLNHGMFVGNNNEVKACPGGPVIGNYSTENMYSEGNLAHLWRNNPFRQRYSGQTKHKCISRWGTTLHTNYEEQVEKKIKISCCETPKEDDTNPVLNDELVKKIIMRYEQSVVGYELGEGELKRKLLTGLETILTDTYHLQDIILERKISRAALESTGLQMGKKSSNAKNCATRLYNVFSTNGIDTYGDLVNFFETHQKAHGLNRHGGSIRTLKIKHISTSASRVLYTHLNSLGLYVFSDGYHPGEAEKLK